MMRTYRPWGRTARVGVCLAAAIGLVAVAGCGSSKPSETKSTPGQASAAPSAVSTADAKTGGTASVAMPTPTWIFPISAPGYTQGENEIFGVSLYKHLYQYKLDGTEKYNIDSMRSLGKVPEISADGKTMTVAMKQEKWSDGKPITTRDVEFWWNLISANKDKWASYKEGLMPDNITSFKVIDEYTFSMTTDKVYSPAWFVGNQLNRIVPMPQHVWDKDSASATVSDLDKTPAGAKKVFDFLTAASKDPKSYSSNPLWKVNSGAFQLEQYIPNGEVTLKANANYTGEDKAKLDKVIFKPFTSDDAEFNVVRAGQIDYGYIPPAQIAQKSYLESQGYYISPWYGWSITYMPFNFNNPTSGPIFKQKAVRQAMQMMIDQPSISKAIWQDTATPTCGPVPQKPGTAGTTEGCAYKFDPDGAKALLEKNGWEVKPDGVTTCKTPGSGDGQCGEGVKAGAQLKFTVTSESGYAVTSRMMAEIKSQMSKVGIDLTIKEVPDVVSVTQACKPTDSSCHWDLSFFGSRGSWYFPAYASGERLFATGGAVNLGSYSDSKADQLIDATEFSDNESAMKEYNDYLAEDLPVLWMPNPVYQVSAIKKSLQGVDPQDPTNEMFPQDWYLTK